MKKKNLKNLMFTLIITLTIFGVIIGITQIHSTVVQSQSEYPKLTLEISTPKSSYLQLEPIPLRFDLVNRTSQSISWKGALLLFGGNTNLIIQGGGNSENRFIGSKYIGSPQTTPITLSPGQSIKRSGLFAGIKEFDSFFPRPGNYQVRAEFTYIDTSSDEQERVTIVSNPVSISIQEPQGFNRQSYQAFRNLSQTEFSQNNVVAKAQAQQDFVNNYRGTVYAKYVILDLARRYQFLREDAKALRELCKISSDEGFYYAEEVQRILYQADAKLNPPDMRELPPEVPMPVRQHPCLRLQN